MGSELGGFGGGWFWGHILDLLNITFLKNSGNFHYILGLNSMVRRGHISK